MLQGENDAVEANQIALEGVRSIKVVNAYSLQDDVSRRYSRVSVLFLEICDNIIDFVWNIRRQVTALIPR